MFGILVLWILIGLIPAYLARRKGKSLVIWWIYGSLLFIVALPHALLMKENSAGVAQRNREAGLKRCPKCAEWVRHDASVCRYCRHTFDPADDLPFPLISDSTESNSFLNSKSKLNKSNWFISACISVIITFIAAENFPELNCYLRIGGPCGTPNFYYFVVTLLPYMVLPIFALAFFRLRLSILLAAVLPLAILVSHILPGIMFAFANGNFEIDKLIDLGMLLDPVMIWAVGLLLYWADRREQPQKFTYSAD